MPVRFIYAIIGLFVGAGVDLVINLLAAAIQQRAFADQFNQQSIWWLVGLAVVGLFVSFWLGGKVQIQAPPATPTAPAAKPQTVTVTRLQAILSAIKVRGQGIHLSDVFSFGSRIDIDTKD